MAHFMAGWHISVGVWVACSVGGVAHFMEGSGIFHGGMAHFSGGMGGMFSGRGGTFRGGYMFGVVANWGGVEHSVGGGTFPGGFTLVIAC